MKKQKKAKKTAPMASSPLWRVVFYECEFLDRLRVKDDDTLSRRRREIDHILTGSGLDIIGQGTIKYSENGAHGYTYVTGLLQSGAMGHTYPDPGWESVTFVFETCGPVKGLVKKAAKTLKWFLGAKETLWQKLPPVPLQSSVIRRKGWKKRKRKLEGKKKRKEKKKHRKKAKAPKGRDT